MSTRRAIAAATVLTAAAPAAALAGWGQTAPVAPIPFADRLIGESPRVAIDRNGDAIVAWVGTAADGGSILQVAVRPAAGKFGGPAQLSGNGPVRAPAVAIGPGGEAVVAWVENGGVRAATRAPGGPFTSAVGLSSPGGPTTPVDGPDLAVTGDGRAIAVWTGGVGARSAVRASVYTPGAGWTAPITLSSTGEVATEPAVAVNESGDTVVVWRRGSPIGPGTVRAAIGTISRPASSGANARPFFTSASDLSRPGQDSTGPDVDVDETGAAVAVWTRVTAGGDTGLIQTASAAPGAGFGPPRTISGKGANGPRIGVDAVGGATAIWGVDRGRQPSGVQASLLGAGGAWTAPHDLAPPDPTDLLDEPGGARLAVDPAGDAVAAWARDNGETVGFQSAVRPAGGKFGPQESVTGRGDDSDSTAPDVAVSAAGEAVVVWEAGGGKNTALGAVFYEPPPRPRISSLRATPTRFPALTGPVLRFTLSRAGPVVVLVRPPGGGRALAAVGLRGRKGANRIALGARLVTLPPGLYRLTADTGAGRPISLGVAVTA